MTERDNIRPVILCGGVGARLWPLSRKSFPKQFAPLINGKSLFELTLERVSAFSRQQTLVAASEHRHILTNLIEDKDSTGHRHLILEPEPRNTAAAMALAALATPDEAEESLLLFCPADHHIPDHKQFTETILKGVPAAASGAIVTFGITPTHPATDYGYIEKGSDYIGASFRAERFVEKPDAAMAEQFLLQGNTVWNAGIFLAQKGVLLQAIGQHSPKTLHAVKAALAAAEQEPLDNGSSALIPAISTFMEAPDISIDHAVIERHDNIAVVPFEGQWHDVGNWPGFAALSRADKAGNRIHGQGVAREAQNTYIHAPHRPVIALNTKDLYIIDTPDALLVSNGKCTTEMRELVVDLGAAGHPEATAHAKVYRPWGWYRRIEAGAGFQIKELEVKPGAALSLQKHRHRAEHWVVVKGTAEVTRGSDVFQLSENQSTYIPSGAVHRLKNPGQSALVMIEVQAGPYLGEDDIIRL